MSPPWNPRSSCGRRPRQLHYNAEAGWVALSWRICSWPKDLHHSCCRHQSFSPLVVVGVGPLERTDDGDDSDNDGHGRHRHRHQHQTCSGDGDDRPWSRIRKLESSNWWWCSSFGTSRARISHNRGPFEAGEVGVVRVIWLLHNHRQGHGASSQLHKQGNWQHLHVGEGASRWEALWHCLPQKFYEHLQTFEAGQGENMVQMHTQVGICDARTCMLHMVNLKMP